MGWLVGKHFFSHSNIIFFFFSLSVFPLWFRAVRDSVQFPEQQLSAGRNPSYSTLPTVLFDSWDPRLSPTTSSFFSPRKLIFGSAKAATSRITVPTGIRTTQIARIGFAILGFQNSFRSSGFVSCLPTARLLCCCDWEIPTQYYTQQIFLHKNVAL